MQTDLLPELSPKLPAVGVSTLKKLDLVLSMPVVELHLYGPGALSETDLDAHGIARFALSGTTMTLDLLMNGALQSQLWIKSFTMNNTKPGPSKFREIIPAADHGRDQFHCLYTASEGPVASSQIVATLDSPHIIFSVEPIFALSNFFSSAFDPAANPNASAPPTNEATGQIARPIGDEAPAGPLMNFRFDLFDAMVSLLEDDQKSDAQAIRLSLARLSLSKQV